MHIKSDTGAAQLYTMQMPNKLNSQQGIQSVQTVLRVMFVFKVDGEVMRV